MSLVCAAYMSESQMQVNTDKIPSWISLFNYRPINFLHDDRLAYVYAAAFGCSSLELVSIIFQRDGLSGQVPHLIYPWIRGKKTIYVILCFDILLLTNRYIICCILRYYIIITSSPLVKKSNIICNVWLLISNMTG